MHRLANVNSNYYSFLSGIFVAGAVNLYTGAFAVDQFPQRGNIVLMSAFLTFLSGLCWSILSWEIDAIQDSVRDSPDFVDLNNAEMVLFNIKKRRILWSFAAAVLLALLGLGVLQLDTDPINQETASERPNDPQATPVGYTLLL